MQDSTFSSCAEAWKDIEGTDGLYRVSNCGRIWSKPRRRTKGGILKLTPNGKGYLLVDLCKNGIEKWYLVHRLVAEAFIPNPDNLPEVNHKDEDKTNNHVSNLEWCAREYNANYGTRTERSAKTRTNGKLSKPILQFAKDGEFVAEYPSTKEVERIFGYDNSHISDCCLGKRNTAYGYKWKYKSEA